MADYPQPIAEFTAHEKQVKTVNDIYCGSDTAKTYLRQFPREDKTDFGDRQKDCTIDNYVFRTVQSRKNIIFRKPIDLTNITNTELKKWCEEDFDLKGTSLNEFAKEWLVNADRDGFGFAIADTPQRTEEIQTSLDEMQNNIRPYALLIKRNDLFYWEVDSYGNYTVIAFNESYEAREEGLFGFEVKQQVKAYFADGMVRIYRENKLHSEYQRDIKMIPIVKLGKSDIPMFYDMSKINVKQLNRESEKSNYVRIAGSPFPLVFGNLMGNDKDGGVKTISVNQGLHFTSKDECDFKWAEMTGANYNILKEELQELAKQMENISINFATESNVKTATQVEKDSTEDESRLTDRAQMLEKAINELIGYFGELKQGFNVANQEVIVNKDFSTNKLSPEQVQQLQTMRVNGDISWDRLMDELEAGEILKVLEPKEKEAEKTLLLTEGRVGES